MSINGRDDDLGSCRPLASPIYPSSVYSIPDLDVLEKVYSGESAGFFYARDGHPNAATLGARLAKLEEAAWGVVTASGMAAIVAPLVAIVKAGDRIVASDQLYGGTSVWLRNGIAKFGVATDWVNASDLDAVRSALSSPCRALLVETISNPLLHVSDIAVLAEIANAQGTALIVDNTFATPLLCRPLQLGAAIVVESLTKFLSGHSDVTLGAAFGLDATIGHDVAKVSSVWGSPPSPFDCYLANRSLATAKLRVQASSQNARELAVWLSNRPEINRVIYPGLENHPDYKVARKQFAGPPGNILSFELEGGRDAVNAFMRRGMGIPFCPSLGDTMTTCSYPFSTSHRYIDATDKKRLGITEGLVRLSVEIEPIEEIQNLIIRKLGG